jgi:fucose 4-O-acetylase-like acetyltransferase
MQAKTRRVDLDCAKGLGILLVVLGHLVPASSAPPAGNVWYLFVREVLYEFHMPFFMFLSGYVTFLSGAARTAPPLWPTLIRKRAVRLLLPFVIFGLAIVVGKRLFAKQLQVDNMPSSMSQALLGMVWNTDYSPATSVWYVAVLFVLCVVTPVLLWLARGRTWPVLAVAALLYVCPVPHVLYLNRVANFYIFFMVGGVCSEHEARWLGSIDRHARLLLVVFAVAVIGFALPVSDNIPWQARTLIAGLLSMAALHGLVRRPSVTRMPVLLQLGAASFVIYLLNTPCIGLAKGVLLKLFPWDGANFLLYAPLLMLAGTLGPILIKRFVLAPVPALSRITD